jgi:hypothetical protein
MKQIIPYPLWVGHAGDGRDFRRILDAGIQAIVQLAMEEPSLQPPRELIYCRFPLIDGKGNRPELLDLTLHTTVGLLDSRIPILLCCGAGMSRAPAIGAAALSLFLGQSPEHCLEMVVQQHSADVSPGFWAEVIQLRPFDMKARQPNRS